MSKRMVLDEDRLMQQLDKDAQYYLRKYGPQMEALQYSPLARTRDISSFDVCALGRQLQQWDDYKNHMLSESGVYGTNADLGKLPNVALDIVTASYGSSIIPLICSTQPIDEQRGIVYFKETKSQTTRGNVTEGDVLSTPWRAPDAYPRGFSNENIPVSLGNFEDGITSYTGTISGISSSNPIRPNSFRVKTTSAYLATEAQDDGKGNFFGVGIQGTINYSTGEWAIQLLDDPGATVPVTASYGQDFEGGAPYPRIIPQNNSTDIEAQIFVLGSEVGMFKAYAMKKRFGSIAEDEMITDLTNAMTAEIGNTLIYMLEQNVTGPTVTWNRTHSGYSWAEHKLELKDSILLSESNILQNAGRGNVSVIIAGSVASATLAMLPGFQRTEVNASGPALYGTLDGISVIRSPQSNPNRILTIYKGTSMFDAAVVYAPYMPLFVSNTLPVPNNVLQRQGIACVWAGMKVVAPAFINAVDITT
jgi:hypothetical protein